MPDVIEQATREEARRKDDKPWAISKEEAAQHAAEVFGISGIDAAKVRSFSYPLTWLPRCGGHIAHGPATHCSCARIR